MSFPFRANLRPDTFSRLVEFLRSVVERFPDQRTGNFSKTQGGLDHHPAQPVAWRA
jgi:hypothetical protein